MRWSSTLTLAFFSLLVRLPVAAQTSAESPGIVSTLTVTVGKSLMIDSPVKIKQIAAASSDLIESVAIGPREVLING